MATSPPDLLEHAAKAPGDAAAAARILPLVDLTSLGDGDTEAQIEALCDRAIDGGVAAVCVWPRFVPLAKARLDRNPIRLATVANFPEGSDDLARAARETADALAAGAEEVDVVAPIQAILDGRHRAGHGTGSGLQESGARGHLEGHSRDRAPRRARPQSPRPRAPRSWAGATCSRLRPADFRSAPRSRPPQCCSP